MRCSWSWPLVYLLAMMYYFPSIPPAIANGYHRLAMSLMLGGAMGNLIDRLTVVQSNRFHLGGHFCRVSTLLIYASQ